MQSRAEVVSFFFLKYTKFCIYTPHSYIEVPHSSHPNCWPMHLQTSKSHLCSTFHIQKLVPQMTRSPLVSNISPTQSKRYLFELCWAMLNYVERVERVELCQHTSVIKRSKWSHVSTCTTPKLSVVVMLTFIKFRIMRFLTWVGFVRSVFVSGFGDTKGPTLR